jgi:Type I restriction modification DNA specificity domain
MPSRFIPFQKLGRISQGITLSRYAASAGGSYRVINVTNLEDLYVREPEELTQLSVPDVQRYQLHENDVVIAIRGSLLKSSVIAQTRENSICNQNTVFFRSESEEINSLYLAVLLRSEYFRQSPLIREQHSTQLLAGIKVADLRSLKIPLPNLQTQHEIAQLFLSIEQVKKVTTSALETRQILANEALVQALGVAL